MKKLKKVFLTIACSAICLGASAQSFETNLGADLVSSYVWRGQKLDDAALQPSLSLSYGSLSLSAWGSVGIVNGDYKELDLTLSYSISGLSLGLTDYWCANSNTDYFNYSSDTPHVLELGVGYDFGFLSLYWSSNLLGAVGTKANGDDAYASYFEVAAPFSLGGIDWSASLGMTPWESDYYGADDFSIINCSLKASKDIELGSFVIPAFAQLSANPESDRMYMTFGVTF